MARKQQHIYQLLRFINQPVHDKEFQKIYKSFDIERSAKNYKTEIFERFLNLWRNKAYLPKGSNFSIMNNQHVKQVQALFDLFHSSKDYETFHQTAVWARQHINEGMFLYTYSAALVHRKDTQGLAIPAIYELNPQYFFNSEVIQRGNKYKMSHFSGSNSDKSGVYTIHAEYSNSPELGSDANLSYFIEDIGNNAFYYYFNLYFPFWMNAKKYQLDEKRGELFYYVHQQLLARYYLERISHGLGRVEIFNWDHPFKSCYFPSLTYPNGTIFSRRPSISNLQEYFDSCCQLGCFFGKYGNGNTYVNTYEDRIKEAIDLGYAFSQDDEKVDLNKPENFNMLANLIQGNADSPNYRYYGSYDIFIRQLLGHSRQFMDYSSLAPSVLEHYETSLRDPAFYQLSKKMISLFQKFKAHLPAYTEEDLHFSGVEVQKFETDPLVTFYEPFFTDITNGLTVTEEENKADATLRVRVKQYRLNHKKFNYKVQINSKRATTANVRVFIGPKSDIDLTENRNNFVELDHYVCNLKIGENVVTRNSEEFLWFGSDKTSYLDLYEHAVNGEFDKIYKVDDFMNGFPRRFMLPRGSKKGTTYQLYIIVYPYKPYQSEQTQTYYQTKYNQETVFTTEQNDDEDIYDKMSQYKMVRMDSYPIGFPFDRPAEFQNNYFVPNANMIETKIHHQVLEEEKIDNEDYFEEKPKFFI